MTDATGGRSGSFAPTSCAARDWLPSLSAVVVPEGRARDPVATTSASSSGSSAGSATSRCASSRSWPGISNPYLSQIERGLRKPSAEILQQIARALEISRRDALRPGRHPRGAHRHRRPRRRDPARPVPHRGPEEDPGPDLRLVPPRERQRGDDADRRTNQRRPGSVPAPDMRTLAMLSMHTSPLAQPGAGDSGGMNVYVRELASLARPGRRRVSTSSPGRAAADLPRGRRRRARAAGRPRRRRAVRPAQGGAARRRRRVRRRRPRPPAGRHDVDAIHANYWLSGVAGHRLKHELDLPLVSTFHTLARVKAETGDAEPQRRVDAEAEVIGCSDAITASCPAEADELVAHYGADPSRIEIVPPGRAARVLLAGRPAAAPAPPSGSSGPAGAPVRRAHPAAQGPRRRRRAPSPRSPAPPRRAARRRRRRRAAPTAAPRSPASTSSIDTLGLADQRAVRRRRSPTTCCRPTTGPPTSSSCRAARSPSGSSPSRPRPAARPVVAAASAGCARSSSTGAPASSSRPRAPPTSPPPSRRSSTTRRSPQRLSLRAAAMAAGYTWSTTAARLRRLYADLTARQLVDCR